MNIIEAELVFETRETAEDFLVCCKVIIEESGSKLLEKNIYDIIGYHTTDELMNDGNNKLELTIEDLENAICRFNTKVGGYTIEFKKTESKET